MQLRFDRRSLFALLAAITLNIGPASAETAASAVRLIMLEEVGCRYCAAWDAEVGKGYAATDEGRFAPLHRVKRGAPELANLTKPATYTPTFILMSGDQEAGRITGYPGQFYFWEELKELLTPLGFGQKLP